MNATDIHLLPAPERTTTEISKPTGASRKLVIVCDPQQEFRVPVAHLHHSHNDLGVRPDARAPVEVLLAAPPPTHHRHWGIDE